MNLCAAQPEGYGFVSSMTRLIDCQARALGSGAYQALSLPGSTLSIVLSGFLTIFVALIGYNLLLGRSFTIRSGTLAAVKLGAVFALTTSWPAYRTLVYDLVVAGPAQIVGDIGRPAAIPGADGTLVQRLDGVDAAMANLAILGAGPLPPDLRDSTGALVAPPPFAGFNAFALGGSRILFLIAAIGGLGIVRVVAGMMLALGPFFIAFLMFDSTRSLFEGWIRLIAGAALGAVGVSIALGFELALLEPWLASVLARRAVGEGLASVPTELFVITCVFALTIAALLLASIWLARAFRLAPLPGHILAQSDRSTIRPAEELAVRKPLLQEQEERPRARAVADALVALQQRESGRHHLAGSTRIPALAAGREQGAPTAPPSVPVGRSFRRARPRLSASASKRDLI